MEDAVVATGIFLKLFIICANITADNKILHLSVGWEGWLFIAAYSTPTLSFLGGMREASYNNISMRFTQ